MTILGKDLTPLFLRDKNPVLVCYNLDILNGFSLTVYRVIFYPLPWASILTLSGLAYLKLYWKDLFIVGKS